MDPPPIFKAKQKPLEDSLWCLKGKARGGANFPLWAMTDNEEGHRSGERLEARHDGSEARRAQRA